jgi:hypothetical protein
MVLYKEMKASHIATIAFALIFSILPSFASAGTGDNMSGYAWSSNIGWISFNCTNDNSCATADYGVNENADGTLTGYAWSSNIGWIQFGGLGGFPVGTGTYSQNAQVVGSSVRGWIRAISQNGSGWDGWISLSGTSPTYGVSFSGTSFTGYAWGSDVVGWVLFDVHNVYPAVCGSCGVSLAGDATLDVQSGGVSIVNNGSVPYNTVPTFIWTLTNLPSASCAVSKTSGGGTSFSTVSGITSSGSTTGGALTGPTAYTYSIDCTNPTISRQVSFTVATQPPGFSLGGTETAGIQFLGAGPADSETKTFFVNAVGGFSSNVSVSMSNSTCLATAKYSLGGGAFAANPAPTTISYSGDPGNPYPAGSTFRARLVQVISSPCVVTLVGTGGGYTAYKDYIIDPNTLTPSFEEY